ncbi:MAG: class I SAM-dependent methyltransferase [Victivallaceae bacterium]
MHEIRYPEDESLILPARYRIVRCAGCGQVFDDFDADETVFATYYRNCLKYVQAYSAGAGGLSPFDVERFTGAIEFTAPGPGDAIADFGAAKGGLLKLLADRGCRDLFAVDASPDCIRFIRESYGIPGVAADLADLAAGREFDLIFCTQVFEHLFHPAEILRRIGKHLKVGGRLYLDVPDAANYRLDCATPYYFLDREHINHFSLETLAALLEANGFAIEKSDSTAFGPEHSKIRHRHVRMLARKLAAPVPAPLRCAASPGREMRAYLEESARTDLLLRQKLAAEPPEEVYLWGVGAHCMRLLAEGAFDRFRIAGLIDADPARQRQCLGPHRIFPPQVAADRDDVAVIITSVLYSEAIRRQLRQLGFRGRVIDADL